MEFNTAISGNGTPCARKNCSGGGGVGGAKEIGAGMERVPIRTVSSATQQVLDMWLKRRGKTKKKIL